MRAAAAMGMEAWMSASPDRGGLLAPSLETLAKYGLTLASWEKLAARQGYVCAVCKKVPKTGRLNIDHFHVDGWKHMSPGERALWVRGLLCHWCNRTYCGRGITIEKARNVVAYLSQPKPFNAAVQEST